jgi:hypothetical protein
MARIVCGFCAAATDDGGPCVNCRHDPVVPYIQRGQEPLRAIPAQVRLAEAERAVGRDATVEQLAEYLSVDPRTVRRWRADVRAVS